MQQPSDEDPDFGTDDELDASILKSIADDLLPYVRMLEHFGMMEIHAHLYAAHQKLLRQVKRLQLQLVATPKERKRHA